jgi:acyl carrier protein
MIMTIEEIKEKVENILVDEFEIEQEKLQPEALLKQDVGIDSLDFVDIVVAIEREFGFKPSTHDLKQVKTLGELYTFIQERA